MLIEHAQNDKLADEVVSGLFDQRNILVQIFDLEDGPFTAEVSVLAFDSAL